MTHFDIKAVVFDLDGTLIDSKLDFQEIRQILNISPDEDILEHLDDLPQKEKHIKINILEEIETQAVYDGVIYPGVLETLQTFKQQNIPMGILTRNCKKGLDAFLEKYSNYFSMALSREDCAPKPSPEGLLSFLKVWNLKAQHLLYIGDYKFDIQCGRNANTKTAHFNTKNMENPWQADFVFNDFKKLSGIIL